MPPEDEIEVTETYDSRGRRTVMADATGTSTRTYDPAGNTTAFTAPNPETPSQPYGFAYAYDLGGLPVSLTYADGAEFRYSHDPQGLLDLAEIHIDGVGWYPAAAYTYTDDGDPAETVVAGTYGNRGWDYPANHAHQAETYTQDMDPDGTDAEGDNGGIGTAADITTELDWRPDGRLESESTDGEDTGYTYDPAGQLLEADSETGSDFAYTYGPRGERLTQTEASTTTSYTYNSSGELTAADAPGGADDVAFAYDDDGRRITETTGTGSPEVTRELAYDARGLLAQTTHQVSAGELVMDRSYNGDGALAGMVLHYGGDPITVDLLWDPTRPVPQILDSYVEEDLWTRLAYGNERIAFQFFLEGEQAAYGHYPYDHRGSAIPNGYNLVTSDGYDPYGTPNTDLGALMGEYFYLGYRGELHIDSLIHLRNRDYDPATGTFTTPDPLDSVDGAPTAANPYHYADNDPLNRTDPLGLRPTDTDAAFVAGAACAAHVRATRTQRAPASTITAGGCLASVGLFLGPLTVATVSTTAGSLLQGDDDDDGEGGVLYHGTGIQAARDIVANGWSAAAADQVGGDGDYYVTENRADAERFAGSNPRREEPGGEPALVRAEMLISTEEGVTTGLLIPDPLTGAYTVADIVRFEEITHYFLEQV